MKLNEENLQKETAELERQIAKLPAGYIVWKNIKGKQQPYLQWTEKGKTFSKYLKKDVREAVIAQVEKRKELTAKLKALRAEPIPSVSESATGSFVSYRTNVNSGLELQAMVKNVIGYEKRDCYRTLERFLHSDAAGKVCLLYGLRRTGKTTLLLQAISELADLNQAVYIKARVTDTMADFNHDLKILFEKGCRYVFIDEVTLMSDFINSAALFSDVFGMMNMKIVLSGKDSLGFWFALDDELYDRAVTIHTTFIPYREYERLLKIPSIDEYIRFGGTLRIGETAFDDEDAMSEDASFRDDESTRRYIDSAICKNIQHSLLCYGHGEHFANLRELYEANELTGAIHRIIENMTHQFVLKVLTERFKSHDLGSVAEVLRKDSNPNRRTDVLDTIDREPITAKLMELLEIRNAEDRSIDLTDAHAWEIKEYLKALELIVDSPIEHIAPGGKPTDYVIFTQPGMRYCQAQALVFALMKDSAFCELSGDIKLLVCERILEEVRGRMMEDIVLLETIKQLPRSRQAFKLTLTRGEYDMVIYDKKTFSCRIYEIKHSDKVVPRQYANLIDEAANAETEMQFGKIAGRYVIYRGRSQSLDCGVDYVNVEDYLKFKE